MKKYFYILPFQFVVTAIEASIRVEAKIEKLKVKIEEESVIFYFFNFLFSIRVEDDRSIYWVEAKIEKPARSPVACAMMGAG